MNKTSKKFKDPGSAITHLIAMIGAVICAFPLIGKAVHTNNSIVVFAMSVFISSMILLYGASTLYHSLDISKKVNLFFRRIDHRVWAGGDRLCMECTVDLFRNHFDS